MRGLGHEKPTLLLTSQIKTPPGQPADRCARRMAIENAIDFFHMDALSAAVPMKIDADLQLTLIARALCRLFAVRIGNGKERAKSRILFRDFVKAADIDITAESVTVRIGRQAASPYLFNAGYEDTDIAIPWMQNRKLRMQFI